MFLLWMGLGSVPGKSTHLAVARERGAKVLAGGDVRDSRLAERAQRPRLAQLALFPASAHRRIAELRVRRRDRLLERLLRRRVERAASEGHRLEVFRFEAAERAEY